MPPIIEQMLMPDHSLPRINKQVNPSGGGRHYFKERGFTLVEIMIASAIMFFILAILLSMVSSVSNIWSSSKGKIGEFREARDGFESMTRTISQATLNAYMDFVDANGNTRFSASSSANSTNFIPANYTRQSELRFLSGPGLIGPASLHPTHSIFFQGPLGVVTNQASYAGLENLLNTFGYYLEFNADTNRPSFISPSTPIPRYRFRLMQMMEPSEKLSLYKYTATNPGLKSTDLNGTNWFGDPLASSTNSRILAENIIALIILPKLATQDELALTNNPYAANPGTALAPNYTYDTTTNNNANPALNPHNQLPPQVQITMVAVDEASYARCQGNSSSIPVAITTAYNNAPFIDATKYTNDLTTFTAALQAIRPAVNYRIFTTTVAIKGAKWSRAGN